MLALDWLGNMIATLNAVAFLIAFMCGDMVRASVWSVVIGLVY